MPRHQLKRAPIGKVLFDEAKSATVWTNWYRTPVLKELKAEASMYGAKVCAPKAPNSTALAPKNAIRYFMN